MADVITKAGLARLLGVTRPRITQLIYDGLPVRPDGKLNQREAVEWVKMYVDPSRGGWWGGLRPKDGKARSGY